MVVGNGLFQLGFQLTEKALDVFVAFQVDTAAALAVEPGGADFLDLFDGGLGDSGRSIFTGS